jgi:hypothetical protein
VLLDTHYTEEPTGSYEVAGRSFRYWRFDEIGDRDSLTVFSGMSEHAKWLTLDDICALLQEAGFDQVEVLDTERQRNGMRVQILARRSA